MVKATDTTEKMKAAATEATAKISAATSDAIEQSQEMFTKTTSANEKFMESMSEFSEHSYKSAEIIAKKCYDNYMTNVSGAFEDAKALASTKDTADYFKTASAAFAKSSEKYAAQNKELFDLSSKVYNDNVELMKKFYAKAFAA